MNNFKFSIQNPVNLLILLILVQTIISCEQGPGPSICSGQEFDPDEYACVRGELVPLDDNLPSSSSGGEQEGSGIWNGTADTDWYNASQAVFTITTAEQLAGFAKLVNEGNTFEGKTVKLGNNIALNDTSYWRNWAVREPDNEWVPIGALTETEDEADTTLLFRGTFDGSGFIVSGVYINSAEVGNGFFGVVWLKGAIKNLGVVASYVNGKDVVGGLVGYGYGNVINNSYYRGTVKGEGSEGIVITSVGGLVGALFGIVGDEGNGSIVSNSYFSGVVTGNAFIASGLVGISAGDGNIVSNSYSAGMVTGEFAAAGLIGVNIFGDDNEIKNSYSSCVVTGADVVGLAGPGWSITSSYYNKEVNTPSDEWGGEGKTTSEMKQQATYAGWDFNGIWGIGGDINGGYPYLLGTQQQ
jgi:hypothetical protein